MGGVDKPLVIYEGKPMVDHVIASAPDVAEVMDGAKDRRPERLMVPLTEAEADA